MLLFDKIKQWEAKIQDFKTGIGDKSPFFGMEISKHRFFSCQRTKIICV